MLKQTIKYTDFNGNPREEEVYFNLTEAELFALEISYQPEGLASLLQRWVADHDIRKMLEFTKDLIHKSYGEKSADGRHFDKSPAIVHSFETSALYSDFLMGLFTNDASKLQDFINGVMPADLIDKVNRRMATENIQPNAREQFEARQREQEEADRQMQVSREIGRQAYENAVRENSQQFGESNVPQGGFGQPQQPYNQPTQQYQDGANSNLGHVNRPSHEQFGNPQ